MNKMALIKIAVNAMVLVSVVLVTVSCSSASPAPNCKHDDPSKVILLSEEAATCQKTGLTSGRQCLACGEMILPPATVGKINCIESDWITDKRANYDGDGKKHTECIMCHKVMKTESIPFKVSPDFWYIKNGNTCSLYYLGSDIDVVMPEYFQGCLVTVIDSTGFLGNDNLRSVTIPHTVTKIEQYAFAECYSFEYIVFDGTKAQWNAIEKEGCWYPCTRQFDLISFTVYCTDGIISYN